MPRLLGLTKDTKSHHFMNRNKDRGEWSGRVNYVQQGMTRLSAETALATEIAKAMEEDMNNTGW